MNISLLDVDGHHFPNLALCKIARYHKDRGDNVEWYSPLLSNPDKIYASKVFTFTPDYLDYAPSHPEPIKGGTGYDITSKLPEEIESCLPDFSIYPESIIRNKITKKLQSFGFLTRGCIRHCPWCVVPLKEGAIKAVSDIEIVAQGRKTVTLMDNNFLASDENFIEEQLEKIHKMKLRIDFNQGLDARLVTDKNAKLLAKCSFIKYIRFACDTMQSFPAFKNAVELMRKNGYKGGIFCYILAKDVEETHERILKVLSIDDKIRPFCQPYRNFEKNEEPPSRKMNALASWCNRVEIRKSTTFENYTRRKER